MSVPNVIVRPMQARDVSRVAAIFRSAFNDMYRQRGFGPVVADSAVGAAIAETYQELDPEHCLVVTADDRVVGSGFLHVRGKTAGTGPITIDPAFQARGYGRLLMSEICARADRAGVQSLRLIQDAFNERSFCLYSRVGFAGRELLVRASFRSAPSARPGRDVRRATAEDLERIVAFEKKLLSLERPQDHALLFRMGEVFVTEDGDRELHGSLARLVRGGVAVIGPAVGMSRDVMLDLIHRATSDLPARTDVRLLVPARYPDLIESLMNMGLEVHSLCTYMVRGEYEPFRAYYVPTLFPESG